MILSSKWDKDFSFYVPTRLYFGAGVFRRAGEVTASLGHRVLLVTGRSAMDRLGFTEKLLDDFKRHSLAFKRYYQISSSPTLADVDQGAAEARGHRADVVVALGGGSVLDCAKAIAAVVPSERPAVDFLYRRTQVERNALPLVCIPTTAGTGSELNRSAIVMDPDRCFKDGIRSDYLFPRYALVDPQLTWSVPRLVTAQTGFDTLAHAVESYVSPKSSPIHDDLALRAIRIVSSCLPLVLEQPQHEEARERLAYASTTMGINLACVGTCFPHRADKSLCALRPEIAHGQSVALFYPHWVRSCYRGASQRFLEIATILCPEIVGQPVEEAASICGRILADFIRSLGLQLDLKQFVTEEDIPNLVAGVAGDLTVNPVPIEREELNRLFHEILAEEKF